MSCLGITWSSFAPCLPSLCGGSRQLRWRRVTANERAVNGEFRTESIVQTRSNARTVWRDKSFNEVPIGALADAGVYTRQVSDLGVSYQRTRTRFFYEHIESGDFFDIARAGDEATIRSKSCAVLTVAIPYGVGMMVCNLVAALVHTVIVLKNAFSALYFEGVSSFFTQLKTGFTERVLSDLFIVVASPLYWIAMEFSAFTGLISPLDGMRNMERVDRAWHRNATYRDEIMRGRERNAAGERQRTFQRDFSRPLVFLVWCLHSRGNRNEMIDTPQGQMRRFENITIQNP